MKLYAIRIFVSNWDSACQFYEKILNLPLKFKDSDLGWAEFDVGGPSLGIERVNENDEEGRSLVGRFMGISLQVENIDSSYTELSTKGVQFIGTPEKQSWGGALAHFKDPSGNILTLVG